MTTIASQTCPQCNAIINESDIFCGSCGYPVKGTVQEQQRFSAKKAGDKYESDIVVGNIKQARTILFVIAGMTFIYGAIMSVSQQQPDLLIIYTILALIYAGLGFWAKSKPFPATLIALLLYVGLLLFSAFVDPTTIYKGIIMKIIFIGALIKASYGSYKFKINEI